MKAELNRKVHNKYKQPNTLTIETELDMSMKKPNSKSNHSAAGARKPVRLSQCMIVKNEEKNIEKALSWAKGIAFEQIVVDTGSTDRTVELAESMGAKVYHFEWINDFSAAKNYAIEQANGRWIAFLDADEFFPDDDAKKLKNMLEHLTNNDAKAKAYKAITCPIYNIDDAGNPASVAQQRRIFRNLPDIRYIGRIHEYLPIPSEKSLETTEIGIIHTGYSESAYKETGKAVRNIEMLEEEYKKNPGNANLKCYLADSLYSEGSPDNLKRAIKLYTEALEDDAGLDSLLKHSAYLHMIDFHEKRNEIEEAIELCRRASADFPDIPDFHFHLGLFLCDRKEYSPAWEALVKSEKTLGNSLEGMLKNKLISNPVLLFAKMAQAAQGLDNKRGIVNYCVLALKENKYQKDILALLLSTLTDDENTSDEDILGLLIKLYDFGSIKDKAFMLVSSKMAGNRTIFDNVRSFFSGDEISRLKIPTYKDCIE